jgi:hypothetical protein
MVIDRNLWNICVKIVRREKQSTLQTYYHRATFFTINSMETLSVEILSSLYEADVSHLSGYTLDSSKNYELIKIKLSIKFARCDGMSRMEISSMYS